MGSSESLRLLVVSNDPLVIDEVRFGFPSEVEVLLARDARSAGDVMQDVVPAAVVIDIHTGSAGGFALSRDMAMDPRLGSVPIMMLLEREQDLWLARQARAAIARVKPIATEDLVFDAMSLVEREGAVPA